MLVWDFDGTLADSFGGIRASVDTALDRHGLAPVDPNVVRSLIGLSLDKMFAQLVDHIEDTSATADTRDRDGLADSLAQAYRRAYREEGRERVALFPGIDALLDDLRVHGIRSAIATSKGSKGVHAQLELLGLAGYFATVVSNDDVANGKPAPDMAVVACRGLGIAPADAVVVGDTVFDILMGRHAGAVTCAVTWGNQDAATLSTAGPTYMAGSVDELAAVLDQQVRR